MIADFVKRWLQRGAQGWVESQSLRLVPPLRAHKSSASLLLRDPEEPEDDVPEAETAMCRGLPSWSSALQRVEGHSECDGAGAGDKQSGITVLFFPELPTGRQKVERRKIVSTSRGQPPGPRAR